MNVNVSTTSHVDERFFFIGFFLLLLIIIRNVSLETVNESYERPQNNSKES